MAEHAGDVHGACLMRILTGDVHVDMPCAEIWEQQDGEPRWVRGVVQGGVMSGSGSRKREV
jgi:hypothetical protein